ncbi:MAG: hypothetical protein N5P05_000711 [Chroococcopsis gigantea SAG 12.99]|jgi:hypothetical protein|nr:hypothetical protein [Chlorogloea purpurea SAG 13.99]MDV2999105.1 hypothetical protein [Chroococcopsis gigantea SAG 12.99]
MNKLITATLALSFFPVIISAPHNSAARAQIISQYSAPYINNFTVQPVDRLTPGNELIFAVEGTPKANVRVNLGNGNQSIRLREVQSGYYEGSYTIRTQDRFNEKTPVRVNLQVGNQSITALLSEPLVVGNNNNPNNRYSDLKIDRFTVNSSSNLQPGTELVFTLTGTPDANATYSIDGIAYDQPMRQISPGRYEGRYVVRRQDVFSSPGPTVTASLKEGDRVIRARLEDNLNVSNSYNSANIPVNEAFPLEILSPANNSQVNSNVELKGITAPNATVTVNVTAKNNLIGSFGFERNLINRTVQADARGNFNISFQPSGILPGTRYEVNLNASNGQQSKQETLVLVQQ